MAVIPLDTIVPDINITLPVLGPLPALDMNKMQEKFSDIINKDESLLHGHAEVVLIGVSIVLMVVVLLLCTPCGHKELSRCLLPKKPSESPPCDLSELHLGDMVREAAVKHLRDQGWM
jgi:uncharacterized ferredoxin-like protein